MQRRLPKFGFTSRKSLVSAEINLYEIAKVEGDVVDLSALQAAGLVKRTFSSLKLLNLAKFHALLPLKAQGF